MRTALKLLAMGAFGGTQSLQSQLEQYGTIKELWLPENYVQSGSLISEITGVNGFDLVQGTTANKPQLIAIAGGGNLIRYFDSNDDIGIQSGTPFSDVTDGTLFIVIRCNVGHVPFGDGTVTTRRGYIASDGSATADGAGANFGAPVWEKDGVVQVMTTRDNAFDAMVTPDWRVCAAKSIDISTWVAFNVGKYSSAGSLRIVGYVDAIVLYSDLLSDVNVDAVTDILRERIDDKIDRIPTYTESSPVTVTPDAAAEANTGIHYDALHDEIVVSKWGGPSGVNKLLYYDRATLTLTDESANFTANATNIQSVVYIPALDAYLVSGTRLFQRDGTFIRSYTIPAGTHTDSAADFKNGYFYYIDSSDKSKIHKCTIDASALTLVETITINRIAGNDSSGLNVDTDGYWFWEGALIRKYSAIGILMEEIPSTGANPNGTEGITKDLLGNVYVNRDDYYHSSTANGNKIWLYTKN